MYHFKYIWHSNIANVNTKNDKKLSKAAKQKLNNSKLNNSK